MRFLDLTLPQYWLPRYDWVLSLEVLEHIPHQYESIVLDNIVRAAGSGVVLSWAPPGQKGFQHINGRYPAYVEHAMFSRHFVADRPKSLALRQEATLPWFKKNIVVFVRR